MATSNIKPVYPSGIFPWTDRVDNQSVDFANDINSAVAEIESVETTIGTNPQTETGVPAGLPVNYSTVSARITDAMTNAQLPYASLTLTTFALLNSTSGTLMPYKVGIDPYGCFNGSDITIPSTGWWSISASQQWSWWGDGYSHIMLTLNGSSNILDEKLIDWEFSGNQPPVIYSPAGEVISGNPAIVVTPRWWIFGKRPMKTWVRFDGPLHKGDRISVYSENGTSNPSHVLTNLNLKAIMMRTIPSSVSFVSG